ncbi:MULTISPECIES: hypothetical protein [Colwellia]|uniref:SMODS and SLOG-associating 2TM effector domain-containing protein n=1 Tax=Colwellia marinimaniae TaxID=1513592 RepID=A0ABQ0MS33_9GAMM|nr:MULTISPECIES: hypothetical protein [Colwellia]GAW95160.1 hypothetical protein MTCD1_00759 [Colwellia marinimaniae]
MEDKYTQFKIEKLSDQFTGSTRTVRRNLLIAASIGIALSVDGIKFGTFFGIDFKDATTSKLAIGAIAVIALYELISFIVYAAIDHRSWVLKANSILHSSAASVLNDVSKYTRQVQDQLGYIRGKMTSDDDSVVEAIKSQAGVIDGIVNKANDEITNYVNSLNQLKSQIKIVNFAQLGRIYLIDWGIPVFMGGLSLYRNHDSILEFLSAVFV